MSGCSCICPGINSVLWRRCWIGREAYRSSVHPYRAIKYEDAKLRLRRWLVAERMRSAELEFLQSARARIKIATVLLTTPDERARY